MKESLKIHPLMTTKDVKLRIEFFKITEAKGKMIEKDRKNLVKAIHVYGAYKHTQKMRVDLNNFYRSRSTGYPLGIKNGIYAISFNKRFTISTRAKQQCHKGIKIHKKIVSKSSVRIDRVRGLDHPLECTYNESLR